MCADDDAVASSSSEDDAESSSDTDSSDEDDEDIPGAHRQRQPLAPTASNAAALWPHAPIGMRPISAGASRKRPASSTPGSDQVPCMAGWPFRLHALLMFGETLYSVQQMPRQCLFMLEEPALFSAMPRQRSGTHWTLQCFGIT